MTNNNDANNNSTSGATTMTKIALQDPNFTGKCFRQISYETMHDAQISLLSIISIRKDTTEQLTPTSFYSNKGSINTDRRVG